MEKEANYIVAIDMGTSNVVTLIGKKAEDGKISIVASSCVKSNGMARGDVKNTDQIVNAVKESLLAIEKEYGIKVCEAYVGLSGQHIKCEQHSGYVSVTNREGEVREDDVLRLSDDMRNISVPPGEVIIHILPQNYILDDDPDISHPVGMVGKRLAGVFNIITGDKNNLALVDRCMRRADVNIVDVILNSLASAEAVLVDDEKELGVAVVDIGGGTCDICIYYDKTIRYLGVIPIGGNIINKDIKSCGVLERLVEKLKVKFGSAMSDSVPENQVITLPSINSTPSKEISQKTLASIIEARMMDVIERLEEIIERVGYKGKLSGGIVLTGGGAQLKDLDKLFARHLKCEVRIAFPDLYVTADSVEKVNSPMYSTAVGLLLKGAVIGRPTKTIAFKKSKPVESVYEQFAEGGIHSGQQQGYLFDQPAEDTDTVLPQVEVPHDESQHETHERRGFGGWLKNTVGKVKGIIDPQDDELEDNNF